MADVHQIAVDILIVASLLSLVLLILKSLGKEVESTLLIWIRLCKRIEAERAKKPNRLASTSKDDDFGADPTRPVGVDCRHESVGTSVSRANRYETAGSRRAP